jgi:hypothetical protein
MLPPPRDAKFAAFEQRTFREMSRVMFARTLFSQSHQGKIESATLL